MPSVDARTAFRIRIFYRFPRAHRSWRFFARSTADRSYPDTTCKRWNFIIPEKDWLILFVLIRLILIFVHNLYYSFIFLHFVNETALINYTQILWFWKPFLAFLLYCKHSLFFNVRQLFVQIFFIVLFSSKVLDISSIHYTLYIIHYQVYIIVLYTLY